jgi:hypothetical protein
MRSNNYHWAQDLIIQGIMKHLSQQHLSQKTKQLKSHLVDWMLFKGFELFITIYGN